MKNISILSLLGPNKKSIVTLLIINILLFSSIGSLIYYNNHFSNQSIEKNLSPISNKFLEYEGNPFWISYKEASTSNSSNDLVHREYYLETLRNTKQYLSVKFFQSEYQESFFNGNQTNISVNLLLIKSDYVLILLNERALNQSDIIPQSYSLNRQYLIVFKISMSSNTMILSHMELLKIVDSNLFLKDLKEYNSKILMLFRPNYDNIFNYLLNETNEDSYSISSTFYNYIQNTLKLSKSNSYISPPLFKGGNLIDFPSFQKLNITNILVREFGESMGLHKIHYLKDTYVNLIDSQGNIHITGDVQNVTNSYNIEGNGTSFNTPDYLVTNPYTNLSIYWDIRPLTTSPNSYDSYQLKELANGSILIAFIGQLSANYYNNQIYNSNSIQFNYTKYNTWYNSKFLQIAIFNPTHPTLSNLIQFNKNISQTNQSTVIFPRLSKISYYPMKLAYSNFIMTLNGDQTKLLIGLTLYDTNNGYRSYLITSEGNSGSSNGHSLIILEYDIIKGLLLTKTEKLLGPDKKINFDQSNNTIPSKIDGINVQFLYYFGMYYDLTGKITFIIAYSASYILGPYYSEWKLSFVRFAEEML